MATNRTIHTPAEPVESAARHDDAATLGEWLSQVRRALSEHVLVALEVAVVAQRRSGLLRGHGRQRLEITAGIVDERRVIALCREHFECLGGAVGATRTRLAEPNGKEAP